MELRDVQLSDAGPITPILKALIICDQVVTDETTKKKTLVGVFDRIWVTQFPALHAVAFYAKLFDGKGEFEVRVDYVKTDTQEVLGNATMRTTIKERRGTVEFALAFPPLPIPQPGEYEFRLWMNNQYIHSIGFTAVQHPSTKEQS